MSQAKPFRWDDVALLMACHRQGSLTAAARTLQLDPATASRRLTQLEEALGVVLFHRGREGLLATAALEQLLPAAEAAELAMARLSEAADGVEAEVEGVVRMTLPPGVADVLLLPILPGLLARHPKLRLEVDASTRYVDLQRREADLAIRAVRPEHGDLVAARLLQVRVDVLGSRERYGDAPPAPLNQLPWIAWDYALAHIPEARWLTTQVPDAQVVLRTSSPSLQLGAAAKGIGVVLAVAMQGRQAGLVPVPLVPGDRAKVDALPLGGLWLVCHRSLRDVPRVDAVWRYVLDEVQSLLARGT